MATATERTDDSDLEHLIAETSSLKTKALPFNEQEYLASVDCISLTWTYLAFLLSYHKTGLLITLCFAVFLVASIFLFTTTYEAPTVDIDYSSANVQSLLDSRLGKINHWCLNGGDDQCSCSDPLDALSQEEKPGWMKAHKLNKDLIKRAITSGEDLDVAFVGDALVELWAGRILGNNVNEKDDLFNVQKVFRNSFTNIDNNGKFNGIPLGIAGDTSPNLLWRLRHGEMSGIDPKVWWVNIGIGDLARHECSEEVVLLGIFRIVEEIRKQKPSAIIVINGLLPTTKVRGGMLSLEKHRFKRWTGRDLWPSIEIINDILDKFADNHHGISYFDPKQVFTETGRSGDHIVKALMNDPIHPSAQGYVKWSEAITESLKSLLKY